MAIAKLQRMLTLEGNRRVPIRLDAPTWQTIDWLCARNNCSWQQWGASVTANFDVDNITATIREAAITALLEETVFADRAEQVAAMESHPIMRNSGILDDQMLGGILKNAEIAGRTDFGGFSVIFGVDEHHQDCVWIQNGMRDGQHFAFVVPTNSNK